MPRSKSAALYAAYTKFEKQHGTKTTLEATVLGKRRIQYEDEVAQDGRNYDVWFDYARLEEGALKEMREEGATAEEEEAAIGEELGVMGCRNPGLRIVGFETNKKDR